MYMWKWYLQVIICMNDRSIKKQNIIMRNNLNLIITHLND